MNAKIPEGWRIPPMRSLAPELAALHAARMHAYHRGMRHGLFGGIVSTLMSLALMWWAYR